VEEVPKMGVPIWYNVLDTLLRRGHKPECDLDWRAVKLITTEFVSIEFVAPLQTVRQIGVEGVLILEVPAGGPAANAGLKGTFRCALQSCKEFRRIPMEACQKFGRPGFLRRHVATAFLLQTLPNVPARISLSVLLMLERLLCNVVTVLCRWIIVLLLRDVPWRGSPSYQLKRRSLCLHVCIILCPK
jgi:hypothetical protein